MSENLNRMLKSTDKNTKEAKSILSRLYRQILTDIGMDTAMWSRLMNRWLDNPANRVTRPGPKRSSEKGNLNKLLSSSIMSIRTFEKGMVFLGPLSFRLEIHITWRNKRTTIHGVDVVLPDNQRGHAPAPQTDEESVDEVDKDFKE